MLPTSQFLEGQPLLINIVTATWLALLLHGTFFPFTIGIIIVINCCHQNKAFHKCSTVAEVAYSLQRTTQAYSSRGQHWKFHTNITAALWSWICSQLLSWICSMLLMPFQVSVFSWKQHILHPVSASFPCSLHVALGDDSSSPSGRNPACMILWLSAHSIPAGCCAPSCSHSYFLSRTFTLGMWSATKTSPCSVMAPFCSWTLNLQ